VKPENRSRLARETEQRTNDFLSAGSDIKLLAKRAAQLTFGFFASLGEVENRLREGGSGIFVAPFLAITAGHITDDFYRFGGRDNIPNYLHLTEHAGHLFQVLDPLEPDASLVPLWHADRSWRSPVTDIALLQFSAENEAAEGLQTQPYDFFEWRLLPPPVGSPVSAVGFPLLCTKPVTKQVEVGAPFTLRELTVTKTYPLRREKGMLNFPCFEVLGSLNNGFSGGPVFYNGMLCGIVCSSSGFDERSYITSLWPLALLDYSNEFGQCTRFGDLLDRGIIVAEDWPDVRGRISKREDEFGKPFAFIEQ
jgi:hypothetical protein